MKVFISWSGERSQALAKALREWMPLVLYYIEPWLSHSDIQAGERWNIEVSKELEGSNFGILCITRENLESAWILFEAGALAKSMEDGRVIPLLLDLDFKEISGPLAQFQAKKADIVGIKELVVSLNKASPTPVADAQLDKLFTHLWGDLDRQISDIPKAGADGKPNRPQGEILEELVASVRNVEIRFREVVDDEPDYRKRRRIRFNLPMYEAIIGRMSEGPRDPIRILIVASFVREEIPWLYELGLEAYRGMKIGSKDGRRAFRRFMEAFELAQKLPVLDESGIGRPMLHLMRSTYVDMIDFFSRAEAPDDLAREEKRVEPEG